MLSRRDFGLAAATSVGAMAAASCATAQPAASAQPVVFSVVYPNHEGARFDLAYYRATHIPLLQRVMNPESVNLIEGTPMGATPPPFVMIAHFHFASAEALQAALANPGMAELRADVTQFTDIRPSVMQGRPA